MVNDGSSNQHSQVTQLTVTFTQGVDITDLAATFSVLVGDSVEGTPLGLTFIVDGVDEGDGMGVNVTNAKVVILKFMDDGGVNTLPAVDATGAAAVGLVDGNYFLNIVAANVVATGTTITLDGDRDGVNGGDQSTEFFRLFGDVNGDRQVDGLDLAAANPFPFNGNNNQAAVSAGDPAYQWYYDVNGDGQIDQTDLDAFMANLFNDPLKK